VSNAPWMSPSAPICIGRAAEFGMWNVEFGMPVQSPCRDSYAAIGKLRIPNSKFLIPNY
jgi:hypothetical protein